MAERMGLRCSPEEYEFISAILVANADEAKRRGNTDAYSALKRFCVRLKHSTFLGEEIESSTIENLGVRVEQAFAEGDYGKAEVAISSLLAAMIRMHADPASEIATQLAPSLVRLTNESAAAQQGRIGAAALERLSAKLLEERSGFAADGWPSPEETLFYAIKFIEYCAAELHSGGNPFGSDSESGRSAT